MRVSAKMNYIVTDEEIIAKLEFEDSGSDFYPSDCDSSESDSDVEDAPQLFTTNDHITEPLTGDETQFICNETQIGKTWSSK